MISPAIATRSILFILLFLLFACESEQSTTPLLETNDSVEDVVSYQKDIRKIFDEKCIACHACYDSPCQLVMTSSEGLVRGAHKKGVYKALEEEARQPTRLHIDAHTEEEWKSLGFASVLKSSSSQPSLLLSMIQSGQQQSYEHNTRLPEDVKIGLGRKNFCPRQDEFEEFQKKHPHSGMPYAVTGLTEREFNTLSQWVLDGATVKAVTDTRGNKEKQAVSRWEKFLNQQGSRQQLVNRYLYEHLFIGHLYFTDVKDSRFYRIIRSSTPPGKTVKVLATTRPNDSPDSRFWYRLIPVVDTIVYKTHITYALNDKKMQRLQDLFYAEDWQHEQDADYSAKHRSNPFLAFRDIPARARYQFMLDDAAFFVRTFIRGPVCHGQTATDVIRDQFWTMFQSPDADPYITDKKYRNVVSELLALPGTDTDLIDFLPEWSRYKENNNYYLKLRQEQYHKSFPEGQKVNDIWNGDKTKTDAFQTVFRHHDSAANQKGLIGEEPLTAWVMDYALLERSYYLLVVNFNVFGNISHQTLTRLYFDLIRHGGEQNFLLYLPAENRKAILKGWYQDLATFKLFLSYEDVDTNMPTAIDFKTDDPKAEFLSLIKNQFESVIEEVKLNEIEQNDWQRLLALEGITSKEMPAISWLPDHSLIRVVNDTEKDLVFSMIRNRAHSNVAFILGENLRYQPEQDTLTVYPGVVGSYPNFIFTVAASELDAFVQSVKKISVKDEFEGLIDNYGIRRTHRDFWQHFHSAYEYQLRTDKHEAGRLDMSRYQNL